LEDVQNKDSNKYSVTRINFVVKNQSRHTIYILYVVAIMVGGLIMGGCRSITPEKTPLSGILEPLVSETPKILEPAMLPAPSPTPGAFALVPVKQEEDTPQPTLIPTEPSTPTPGPSETPVPPLVVTPIAPQFPMMGIEITSFNDIEFAAQAGAYWVRRNALLWSVVEPAEGNRNWGAVATLERELVSISAHGMQTILIVRGTPSWAQKILGIHCGPVKYEKLDEFAAFMHDAVVRYSQPPYNVKYWELGNEPDVDPALVLTDSPYGCWGDSEDAYYGGGYYAEMLKVVYPAIKSADPEAQVLVGGLLLQCDPDNPPDVRGQPGVKTDCSPAKFLEGVLGNGGGNYFDGVSFHAYDYYYGELGKYGNDNWRSSWKSTGPVLIAKANYLYKLLAQHGFYDKFLMNTENAALCGVTGNEYLCLQEDWTNTKAYHLVEAFTTAATLELRANIWYSLTGWRGSSLLDTNRQPVPAYQALAFNDQMLQRATPWGEVTLYQGVKGFAFQRDANLIWVLWSIDGQDHLIPLGSLPSAVYSIYGDSLAPDLNITITLSPIYIKW
jgi:hypothetical protein